MGVGFAFSMKVIGKFGIGRMLRGTPLGHTNMLQQSFFLAIRALGSKTKDSCGFWSQTKPQKTETLNPKTLTPYVGDDVVNTLLFRRTCFFSMLPRSIYG